MSEMTSEEFARLRALDTGEDAPVSTQPDKMQIAIDSMNTKNFLIGRTKETINVPITGLGGTKNIEIRARLSKSELKQHRGILERWDLSRETGEEFIRDESDENDLAVFLAHITIDNSLSSAFWLSDELSPELADEILMAYFVVEPARKMMQIQSFLANRLRTGIHADAAGVGIQNTN